MDRSPPDSRRRLYRILFHGAWIAILLAAACLRFSLPLTPLADNDTWGYLNPGVQSLLGRGFQHTNNRNFLYPGLIFGLLASFRDFRAITVLQHTLGLGTGVLLLAAWRQVRRCFSTPRLPQWASDLAGLFTMGVYLFATEPIHFEFYIRPDVICPFFATLALYSIVRFMAAKKLEPGSGKPLYFGALTILLALFIPSLKPSYWLTSVFLTIPIWLALFDSREPLSRRALVVILPASVAVLLIWLPERHFAAADNSSETFLPESLFSIHALIIRDQLADDVAHPDASNPYSQEKLLSTLESLDAGIAASKAESPHHFESLGYDADYLLYHQPFFGNMAKSEGYNWAVVLPFYKYYYRRTWFKRPLPMLRKVATQLGLFYSLECPAYCDKHFDLRRSYSRSLLALNDAALQRRLNRLPSAVDWLGQQALLRDASPMIAMNKNLRRVINALGNAYVPALLCFLATVPLVIFNKARRAKFGTACAIIAIGFAFNLGNNLGIAVLHTLEVSRYTYVQFATTIWTEMLTFVFLIEVALDAIRFGQPRMNAKGHWR